MGDFFTVRFVRGNFLMLMRRRGVGQRFAWQHFDNVRRRGRVSRGERGRSRRLIRVRMPVIVVLEIFENVADVKEGIAIEADVNESGLHAGEDAGDFAFVNATDESELFFTLDVNFD